jgi:outer membrane protein OmpA-like peptidoglycan-associated protein
MARETVLFTDRAPTPEEILSILSDQPAAAKPESGASISKYVIIIDDSPASSPKAGQPAGSSPRRESAVKSPPRPDGSSLGVTIEFGLDSAEILPEYNDVIANFAEALARDESMRLVIVGHADASGSAAYNLDLSARRAASVRQSLVVIHGVDEARLSTVGLGESDPVIRANPNDSRNRRVEFVRPAS